MMSRVVIVGHSIGELDSKAAVNDFFRSSALHGSVCRDGKKYDSGTGNFGRLHLGKPSFGRWMVESMAGAVFTLLLGGLGTAQAQQLEPRVYAPAPIGLNFLGVGYVYTFGGVATDPSLVITNIQARFNIVTPYYVRTFGLFGREASVTVMTPYAWGNVHGDVQNVGQSVDRDGFADPQVRLAVNILGCPAMTPEEFAQHKPETVLSASLTISAPFGQYDSAKLVNIGTNRWAFKPQLGLSQPVGDWIFELDAGVWLFGDNDIYYGGYVRSQDPLAEYQAHVIYNFKPTLWATLTYVVTGA
jgi:Putative MetA-pathway of phenol degradation